MKACYNIYMDQFIKTLIVSLILFPSVVFSNEVPYSNKIRATKDGIIRVMIIDTGIDSSNQLLKPYIEPGKDVSDNVDSNGHGTHVAGLVIFGPLKKNSKKEWEPTSVVCKQVKFFSCAFFPDLDDLKRSRACFQRAYDEGVDAINYSAGGSKFNQDEYIAIHKLEEAGVVITAAAGNESQDLLKSDKKFYPASYAFKSIRRALTNVVPVENLQAPNELASNSNYATGLPAEIGTNIYSTIPEKRGVFIGQMTGTSQAAAIYMHKLLIDKCNEMNVPSNK